MTKLTESEDYWRRYFEEVDTDCNPWKLFRKCLFLSCAFASWVFAIPMVAVELLA